MDNGPESKLSRIGELFKDGTAIDAAMRKVARDTARRHRQLGQPLIIWRDGRVCEIPPEEIVIDEDPEK